MRAILVFIDGTICDDRKRLHLVRNSDLFNRELVLQDIPVPNSVDCLQQLASHYAIVYIGARPSSTLTLTREWLKNQNYPEGHVHLGDSLDARINIVNQLKNEFDFLVGIGDRWDDNELHNIIHCQSIILEEYAGNWGQIYNRVIELHKTHLISQNKIRLEGKVEGLARVCPHLLSRFSESLWDVYHSSVMQMAESSRESRRKDDLDSFKRLNLNPDNLLDVERWYKLISDSEWEENPLYGLQDHEIVEVSKTYYCHKVTHCYYAELWKSHGMPEVGYQIHCKTDFAWWDKPAWNSNIRFKQPKTIMQGDDYCLFIQYLPNTGE